MDDRRVFVEEIAEHQVITKDTVHTWVPSIHMPANRIGRFWSFKTAEVDDWVPTGGTGRAATGLAAGGEE